VIPPKAIWHIAMRPGKRRWLTQLKSDRILKRIEQLKASVRANVRHPFRVVKHRFGSTKVRWRGVAKNTAQLHTLFALQSMDCQTTFTVHRIRPAKKAKTQRNRTTATQTITKINDSRTIIMHHNCQP
jgi:hypothetical protein